MTTHSSGSANMTDKKPDLYVTVTNEALLLAISAGMVKLNEQSLIAEPHWYPCGFAWACMKIRKNHRLAKVLLATKENVRTVDSFLMNCGRGPCQYKRLFLDEGLMLHPGCVNFLVGMSLCSEIGRASCRERVLRLV